MHVSIRLYKKDPTFCLVLSSTSNGVAAPLGCVPATFLLLSSSGCSVPVAKPWSRRASMVKKTRCKAPQALLYGE